MWGKIFPDILSPMLVPCFGWLSATSEKQQLCTCLVICGNIQTLRLGERIARHFARATVRLNDGSRCQPKIRPTYFRPCWFHVSDGCLRPLRATCANLRTLTVAIWCPWFVPSLYPLTSYIIHSFEDEPKLERSLITYGPILGTVTSLEISLVIENQIIDLFRYQYW